MSDDCSFVYFGFSMPCGGRLEIRHSKPIDDNVEYNEEVEGVIFTISWDDITFPWYAKTRAEAIAIALGCQWGAYEMEKKIRVINDTNT